MSAPEHGGCDKADHRFCSHGPTASPRVTRALAVLAEEGWCCAALLASDARQALIRRERRQAWDEGQRMGYQGYSRDSNPYRDEQEGR